MCAADDAIDFNLLKYFSFFGLTSLLKFHHWKAKKRVKEMEYVTLNWPFLKLSHDASLYGLQVLLIIENVKDDHFHGNF